MSNIRCLGGGADLSQTPSIINLVFMSICYWVWVTSFIITSLPTQYNYLKSYNLIGSVCPPVGVGLTSFIITSLPQYYYLKSYNLIGSVCRRAVTQLRYSVVTRPSFFSARVWFMRKGHVQYI